MRETFIETSRGDLMPQKRKYHIKDFWLFIEKSDGCWIWTGKTFNGYGRFAGKWAHRLAFELTKGKIPKGKKVCHHCDNPPCCRPRHLFTGTQRDNLTDMAIKGRKFQGEQLSALLRKVAQRGDNHWSHRHPELVSRGKKHSDAVSKSGAAKGDRNPARRLSSINWEIVKTIRAIPVPLGWGCKTRHHKILAARFHTTERAIRNILTGACWKVTA